MSSETADRPYLHQPLEARRIFVVKASSAFVSTDLNAQALASYGRLDVIARAAIAALSTRQGPRRDALFYAVLEGGARPVAIELRGWEMPRAFLSEAEIGELLRALASGRRVPGANIFEADFRELVSGLTRSPAPINVFYMHEEGTDISHIELKPPVAFILGDHRGVDPETERWLKSLGIRWLSLGPTPYFTEHCIAFVNAVLDGAIAV